MCAAIAVASLELWLHLSYTHDDCHFVNNILLLGVYGSSTLLSNLINDKTLDLDGNTHQSYYSKLS